MCVTRTTLRGLAGVVPVDALEPQGLEVGQEVFACHVCAEGSVHHCAIHVDAREALRVVRWSSEASTSTRYSSMSTSQTSKLAT